MSLIRVKVQYGDIKSNGRSYRNTLPSTVKFVYVLDLLSVKTINELKNSLEKYIIEQYSYKNIRIVQLTTDDGYALSNEDQCSNVLKDNDRILCIDMEKFIDENYKSLDLENLWCEIRQHDEADNIEKYIQVGLSYFGKLFIRIYGTSTLHGLYLFSIYELIKIANGKRINASMVRLMNTNWYIEAKWEYDMCSSTCLYLICSVKIASSQQVWSKKIPILIDETRMCIEKGEIISLSKEKTGNDTLTQQRQERLQELALIIPSAKRVGPEIDIHRDKHKRITKHECEGESPVQIAYGNTNTVITYQDFYKSNDGTFCQHFIITHIKFSKKFNDISDMTYQERSASVDKPISVVNLTIFYCTDDGSWHECQDIAIAPISLRTEEHAWLADLMFTIEKDKHLSFAIKGYIRVHGEPGRDNTARKRMHKSLPQPFQLKIITTDIYNKQCSLIVEQLNPALEFDTAESFVKHNQSSIKEFVAFVYADDCEFDERLFLAVYLNQENQLVIKSNHSHSIILAQKHFRTMEFNARQSGTTETLLEAICQKYDEQAKTAIALFDKQTYIFYAIRLEISTNTSKTEETILLPLEKIK